MWSPAIHSEIEQDEIMGRQQLPMDTIIMALQ